MFGKFLFSMGPTDEYIVCMVSHSKRSSRKNKASWPKRLAIAGGVLVVLLVALYFGLTSSAFVKSVILPQVGQSLGGELTAEGAAVSPFSGMTFTGISLQTKEAEDPVFQADSVQLRYSLWQILGGTLAVREFTVQNPALRFIQYPDGTSNVDPILKALSERATSAPERPDTKKPLQAQILNVSIREARLTVIRESGAGARTVSELEGFNLSMDRLQNGQPGTLTLEGQFRHDVREEEAGEVGTFHAQLDGSYRYELTEDCFPKTVDGRTELAMVDASGAYADFQGYRTFLSAHVIPDRIERLAVEFTKGDTQLGELQVSGPFDLAKQTGKLNIALKSIDQDVLNLFGASQGLKFGNSTFQSTNVVEFDVSKSFYALNGGLAGRNFSLERGESQSPVLNLDLSFAATADLEEKSAQLQTLQLHIQNAGQSTDLLAAQLNRPMNLSWGEALRSFTSSQWNLAVHDLNFHDWNGFLGEGLALPQGVLDAELKLVAQREGRQLEANINASIQDFETMLATNKLHASRITAKASATIDQFQKINVSRFKATAEQNGSTLFSTDGTVNYQMDNQETRAQLRLNAALPAILAQVPLPDVHLTSGNVQLSGFLTSKANAQNWNGQFTLTNLKGQTGMFQFQDFNPTIETVVEIRPDRIQLDRATLGFQQGFEGGGSITLKGHYDIPSQRTSLEFNAPDLNQNALGPFLQPFLGSADLRSVTLNLSGSTLYDPQGKSTLKTDAQLSNLVVDMPSHPQLAKNPLKASLQLDTTLDRGRLELKQFLVGLTATDRASNELAAQGFVEMRPHQLIGGEIVVTSEGLDITPYYDLLTSGNSQQEETGSDPKQPAPSPEKTSKPGSTRLPFKNFTVKSDFQHFYLHEIAITNFVAAVQLEPDSLTVDPFQLNFLGKPVKASANVNLAEAGYDYHIQAEGKDIPVEPIAKTFLSDSRIQYKGLILLNADIRGKGLTGAELKESLKGNFQFHYTEADIQLLGRWGKVLLAPIAVLLRVPQILESPVQSLKTDFIMGNGNIDVQNISVLTTAFHAQAQGTVPIKDNLMESPVDLPLQFALRRGLAEKAKLVPDGTPPDAEYVQLPPFASITGSLGKIKTETDKTAILGLLAQSATGLPGQVGEKASELIQGLNQFLGSKEAGSDTNAPSGTSTNESKRINPFGVLKDLLPGGEKETEKPEQEK